MAVKQDEWTLKFASDRLKNDPEVVMEACKNDTNIFIYVGDKLKEKYPTVDQLIRNK